MMQLPYDWKYLRDDEVKKDQTQRKNSDAFEEKIISKPPIPALELYHML